MKIVVVGATDVGKTMIIKQIREWFLENTAGDPEFVEVSWPPPAFGRVRRFSSKRVKLGIIIAEPNRYSLIFLKSMYQCFSPHTPKIVILNKIDTLSHPFAHPRDDEVELYENFCLSRGCDVLKICAFEENSHIWAKIFQHYIEPS